MDAKEQLIEYYSKKSKHSNYQVLPTILRELIGESEVTTRTRHEKERLRYILNKIDVQDKTVIDIGGNTGYFIFELLGAGAKKACLYEGNIEHANFVKLARDAIGVSPDNLRVISDYFSFGLGDKTEKYDVGVLLNVLHHVGDDYGDDNISIDSAKDEIIEQLRFMSKKVNTLVFQLGFNWQGDPSKPLFDDGLKQEIIEYIKNGIEGVWSIKAVGIAEKVDHKIVYNDLDQQNIQRDDSLGEFLNRPLFILEAE